MGKFTKSISSTGNSIKMMPKGKKIYAGLWVVTGILLASLIGVFVGFADTSSVKDTTNAQWKIDQELVPASELKFVDKGQVGKIEAGEVTLGDKDVTSLVINGQKVDLTTVTQQQINDAISIYKDFKPNAIAKPSNDKILLVEKNVSLNDGNSIQGKTSTWDTLLKNGDTISKYNFVNLSGITPFFKDKNGTETVNPNFDASLTGVYMGDAFQVLNGYYSNDYARDGKAGVYQNLGADGTFTKLELTSEARSQQNAIASVGALFALSITGAIFTTAAVEYAAKKRGGKK